MGSEIIAILQDVWTEILEIWPYFLLGVALEAWIRTKKWHVKIRKTLLRYGYAAIAVATLLGVISPLCACGILPLTISLILGGLPLAPAMSLLVASPLMSPAGFLLAGKNLGWTTAVVEVAGGLFLGLYAGAVTHLLETRGFDVKNLFRKTLPAGDFHDHDYPEEVLRCHCSEMFSKKVEARTGNPVLVFLAKMWEGGEKVGKYLLLGLFAAALARRYAPDWIDPLLTSTNPLALLGLGLAVAPLHITQITASTILFGFSHVDPGSGASVIAVSRAAQMVLLVGGPVTALPVMGVFLTLFKPRVFFLYLGICLSGTLLVALTYQLLG